jgi:hypothetical protein
MLPRVPQNCGQQWAAPDAPQGLGFTFAAPISDADAAAAAGPTNLSIAPQAGDSKGYWTGRATGAPFLRARHSRESSSSPRALLGAKVSLDDIEHAMLRKRGDYDDPRVHFAVNCASIGCPALRDEAFTAAKLEAQLEDGMRRWMGDRTRNRVRNGQVEASAIFKWFKEDFNSGYRGYKQLEDVFAAYAEQLSDKPEEQAALRAKTLPVSYLDYDWSLNDTGR